MHPEIQQLLDERAIVDVCIRYADAIDDRDWDRFRSCFTPDAVGIYHADRPLHGRAAIEDTIRTAVAPLGRTQHLVGTFVVDLAGDEATSRCYLHAQHVREGVPGGEQYVIAGCYRDRFTRTADGWRIRERRLDRWWTAGNPAVTARGAAHRVE
ncbi:nuclear transport factor 2 family protein [Trujillonella humicola]|uniref:nuclear transport factor 2 family protein n=1 Tax=Trujillonella humicola TaxID=3383699 RepID=UPI003905A550